MLVTDGQGRRVAEGNELMQPAVIAASACASEDGCTLFSPVSVDSFLYSSTAEVEGYITTLPKNNHLLCTSAAEPGPEPAANGSASYAGVVRLQLGTETNSIISGQLRDGPDRVRVVLQGVHARRGGGGVAVHQVRWPGGQRLLQRHARQAPRRRAVVELPEVRRACCARA